MDHLKIAEKPAIRRVDKSMSATLVLVLVACSWLHALDHSMTDELSGEYKRLDDVEAIDAFLGRYGVV